MNMIERIKWNIQLKSFRNEGIWKVINELCCDLDEVCSILNSL